MGEERLGEGGRQKVRRKPPSLIHSRRSSVPRVVFITKAPFTALPFLSRMIWMRASCPINRFSTFPTPRPYNNPPSSTDHSSISFYFSPYIYVYLCIFTYTYSSNEYSSCRSSVPTDIEYQHLAHWLQTWASKAWTIFVKRHQLRSKFALDVCFPLDGMWMEYPIIRGPWEL